MINIPGKLVDINDFKKAVIAVADAMGFHVRDTGYNVIIETPDTRDEACNMCFNDDVR